jgi:RNA polymerase sigma-70 factor (ECF subfamily)
VTRTLAPVLGDDDLLQRLRAGDEAAFVELVDRYHTSMIRLARSYVPSHAVAEEVVQDTWLGVVKGLDRFEGRSSLKTWLFRILLNRARTTGGRERRLVPVGGHEPTVDPARFAGDGQWSVIPTPWTDEVDDRLVAADTIESVRKAIDDLPDSQRMTVLLHDLEGLSGPEVSELLQISEGNQRVLLHRGRAAVRQRLAGQLGRV